MTVVNSLMKIDVSDRQDVFLICSYDEHKKHIRIIILDESEYKAFAGYATDIDLRSQAATIHMSFTDFMSLTIKALTKNKHDGDKFLYFIDKNCEGFIFKWKSIDQEETIINIGSVKITESDYRSVTKDALFLLSEEMSNAQEKWTILNESLCDLKKEVENSMRLLTDMDNIKERVENELYSKFTLVLNEKKRQIRDLKRKIHDTSLDNVNKGRTGAVKSRKLHQISDSSDEGVSDAEIMNVAGPSTSKRNNSLLFFDDDEPQLLVSPSKKRNRNRCNVTKSRECHVNKSRAKSPVVMESESEDDLLNNL